MAAHLVKNWGTMLINSTKIYRFALQVKAGSEVTPACQLNMVEDVTHG